MHTTVKKLIRKPIHSVDQLSEILIEFSSERNITCDGLCGVPYTALPIATLMSVKLNQPMVMRRKEAKSYGTKKLVEGHFNTEEKILIVEDVVTSGSSILETYNDLIQSGLVVTDAVVVVDRQQGGTANLQKNGIKIHPLITLSQVMDILHAAGKVDLDIVKAVNYYISINQVPFNSTGKLIGEDRLLMPFNERAAAAKCSLSKTLFDLMLKKKSNLCLAADVNSSEHLLKLAEMIGDNIVILKTHIDVICDFTHKTAVELKKISQEKKFLIMEDRKFGDIGNTVRLQYVTHCSWADLITVHALPGSGVLDGLKQAFSELNSEQRGIFVVAELSSKNNLITPNYTKEAVTMIDPYRDIVAGFVCQSSSVITSPGLIQLTPGVKLLAGSDDLGQQYVTPEIAVCEKGADIVVVGRGITEASVPKETAEKIQQILWNSYEKRIKSSITKQH
ncbi:rudimentary-like isoform X2 [Lycorma delicatula]|uniref:rudimentary-like isoform X2 n=1 Tax=Lycorma delicatula TaxID=130591 RepID=UPI003F511141